MNLYWFNQCNTISKIVSRLIHLQNTLIKCEAPKQTSILRRQDSYWQQGGILTIWRDPHMQKRMMLDLLRCPGASSPSSGLSNLKTIRLPALMCNIKWIYNSFKHTFFMKETASLTFFGGFPFIFRILSFFFSPVEILKPHVSFGAFGSWWLWDSKDVLLLRSNYPPAVSFPQAQDETQKRLCAPKVKVVTVGGQLTNLCLG